MGLHLNYEFSAPAETDSRELEAFLQKVQQEAQKMNFDPTVVLNVPFDTRERREFAGRLGGGRWVEDERLKTGVPREDHVLRFDSREGDCRVAPVRGVVLVVTDRRNGAESCFGFFQYPEAVQDEDGNILAETGLNGRWAFRDYISSADPRYRTLLEHFQAAGYVEEIRDDYAAPA